jgi:hypothetical protein
VDVDAFTHLNEIHPGWNHDWQSWLQSNPGASAGDMYDFGLELMEEYDIIDLLPFVHPYGL